MEPWLDSAIAGLTIVTKVRKGVNSSYTEHKTRAAKFWTRSNSIIQLNTVDQLFIQIFLTDQKSSVQKNIIR